MSGARAERPTGRVAGSAEHGRADRVRRRRRIVLGAGALVGGSLALWFLATGPLLSVRSVQIKGDVPGDVSALDADLERAAADGTVVRPPVGAIRAAAATHPWVESASVSRAWPLGLVVRVVPATPAAVATDGEAAVLVADDGRVLGDAPARAGLPRVVLGGAPPAPGESLPPETRAPVALAAAAAPELATRLRGLRMRDGRLVGRLTAGPELRLGAPDDVVSKATALSTLLSNLSADEERAATYIDASVPERPSVGGLAGADATEGEELIAEENIDP